MSSHADVTIDRLDDARALVQVERLEPIGIGEVVTGPGAIEDVAAVLGRQGLAAHSRVCVLSDSTPKSVHGVDVLERVRTLLSNQFRVESVEVTTHHGSLNVLADETTVAAVRRDVAALRPSALVTVGSGTMADIGKVVASELSCVHVVVQSAVSVNGFADNQSVLLINGAKRTTPSGWPDALVIDLDVVRDAPIDMCRSGLGDQLSMFSAAADWYLASVVGFDTSYSSAVVDFMRRDVDSLLARASELGRAEEAPVATLSSLLTRGGLAMGMAGRTAPSSGTEHVISHLLEMHADAQGEPVPSHGSQVGVASVLAAVVWRRVRASLDAGGLRVTAPDEGIHDRVMDAFSRLDHTGTTATECWNAYERKLRWLQRHLDDVTRVVDGWGAHDGAVDQLLVTPRTVADALRAALAPVGFAQLAPAPDPEVVTWAVTNCHLMRDRFNVVDLAELVGLWTPDFIAEAIDEHATLVGA